MDALLRDMYVNCMYWLLTRMHEDMLPNRGVYDTLGNSGFSQVSGELVSFRKLGHPDLYILF